MVWLTVGVDAAAAGEWIAWLEAEIVAQAARITELEALVLVLLDKVTVLERLLKGRFVELVTAPVIRCGHDQEQASDSERPLAQQGRETPAGQTTRRPVITHRPVHYRGCGAGLDGCRRDRGVSPAGVQYPRPDNDRDRTSGATPARMPQPATTMILFAPSNSIVRHNSGIGI